MKTMQIETTDYEVRVLIQDAANQIVQQVTKQAWADGNLGPNDILELGQRIVGLAGKLGATSE